MPVGFQIVGQRHGKDWHAGRNAVYQLAALTIGARTGSAATEPLCRLRMAVSTMR
jgi:hypothetical protein